jgi:hypothetical protein
MTSKTREKNVLATAENGARTADRGNWQMKTVHKVDLGTEQLAAVGDH